MTRAPHRKTEFLLLLAVQIVLVFGLALVFLGKKATTDFPTVPININTATASQLAQTLSVDKETAKTLVMARGAWLAVGLQPASCKGLEKRADRADKRPLCCTNTKRSCTDVLERRSRLPAGLLDRSCDPAKIRAESRPIPAAVYHAVVVVRPDAGLQCERPVSRLFGLYRAGVGASRCTA